MVIDGGFVDLQVNGLMGLNFSEPGLTPDKARQAAEALRERGTGAFCPTVVTSPLEIYETNLPVLADAVEEELPARCLGIHLEGPFISPADGARGAHRRECVRAPDPALYDKWQELARGRVVLVTLAPDVDGAIELIRHIVRDGRAAVGIGHSNAGARQIAAAVEAGARFSTHLGNGIPSQIDRHRNPLWPQLAEDGLQGFFITDGHHLPADYIKVALRAKGPGRFIVTSDSASVAGLPPGEYTTAGRRVVLEPSGRLGCFESEYLAGSSACMLDCMNHLAGLGLMGEAELVRVGRENALELVGSAAAGRAVGGPKVVFEDGTFSTVKGEDVNG